LFDTIQPVKREQLGNAALPNGKPCQTDWQRLFSFCSSSIQALNPAREARPNVQYFHFEIKELTKYLQI